jgi:hypothetical protein
VWEFVGKQDTTEVGVVEGRHSERPDTTPSRLPLDIESEEGQVRLVHSGMT